MSAIDDSEGEHIIDAFFGYGGAYSSMHGSGWSYDIDEDSVPGGRAATVHSKAAALAALFEGGRSVGVCAAK